MVPNRGTWVTWMRRGYLYLKDRKQDLIVTGGENVYSSEVEAVLNQHPGVLEVAVIGVPDEIYGEKVIAVATVNSDSCMSQAELTDFCRDKIGGYKIPKQIHIVESLPKSALGKILKTELRSRYSTPKTPKNERTAAGVQRPATVAGPAYRKRRLN